MAASDVLSEPRAETDALAHLPGGGGLPLLGGSLEFIRDPFGFHARRRAEHGPVYKSRLFGKWSVALNGADALELVLMDRERNFSSKNGWRVLHQLFPDGLMLRDFDDHRAHRRVMQAAFKPAPMRDYVERMNTGIAATLDGWSGIERFRFYPAIKSLTLDLGAAVFMGLDVDEEARRLNQAFIDEVAASIALIRRPLPGTAMARGVRARAYLLDYFRTLIPQRREGNMDDMFTQLCRAESEEGRRFSDEEIVNHLNFLMMAAHDTTTSGLTTMAWALARHPEWQEAIRAEIDAIGGATLDYDATDQMPVTERVFKEALRLHPPVPFIPRCVQREFDWQGYRIPAGVNVSVLPGVVMRDPELWREPERFDPDRFLPERAEDQNHRFAWSPFGGGAHKCIGLHFAMLQVKAFTFQFLQRYRPALTSGHDGRWQAIPIPRPRDGLPLVLHAA